MTYAAIRRCALAPFTLILLVGCAGEEAHVNRPYEFDRDAKAFTEGPTIFAGTDIEVCYAKSETTPDEVRRLAVEECARADLQSVFVQQVYDRCPLTTPVAAIFQCVEGTAVTGRTEPAAFGAPSVPLPAATVPAPAGARRSAPGINAEDVSTTAKSAPFPTYLFDNGERRGDGAQ